MFNDIVRTRASKEIDLVRMVSYRHTVSIACISFMRYVCEIMASLQCTELTY